jgi:hypothetical protein
VFLYFQVYFCRVYSQLNLCELNLNTGDFMSQPKPLPIGADVYFLRAEHDLRIHPAKVVNCYRMYGGDGFQYTVECPTFPVVLGFAQDDELYIERGDAEIVLMTALVEDRERRRQNLLEERNRIDEALSVLDAESGESAVSRGVGSPRI